MSISYHIADCHRILDANPQDWDTRLRLADLLDELGDEDGAECQRWLANTKTIIIQAKLGLWCTEYYHSWFENRIDLEKHLWAWRDVPSRDRLIEQQLIEMDNKRSRELFNKLFGKNTDE